MLARFGFLLVLLALCGTGRAAFDISRPPIPQDIAAIRAMGWAAAADVLEEQLTAAWKPGHFAQVGSSAAPAFRQWQLLWQWCRLLGTPEPEAIRAFMGRRVLVNPDKPDSLLVVTPGQALPADRTGRPLPTAADKIEPMRIPPDILQALLPDDYTPQPGPVAARAREDFLAELAADGEFLREFFAQLTPYDFPPVAITRLQQLRSAHANRWPTYRSLMIAFALVYDQREPSFWPHHQVEPKAVPRLDEPLEARFEYYASANEARRLEHDLRRLTAAEMRFLVDAPVPRSELEWAAKNVKFRRDQFDRTFGMVNYDHRRVEKGVFVWPNGSYKLGNIELWGGICTDQAYFSSIAGKAKGIPTLYFAGQGTDGGHAWFGFYRGNGKWEMDAGRYQNQNYTVGRALDPQTWLPISDHELAYVSGTSQRGPAHDAALGDLVMAEIFARRGDSVRQLAAADSAIKQAPGLVDAWEARERALVASGQTDQLRAHLTQAIETFRREEDLRVRYQARLADLQRASGDAATAQAIEDRMIRENRRGRADLSSSAAGANLSRLVSAADYDGAMREFRSLAVKLGRTGGGNFFYEVVRPFVEELRAAGQTKDADRALEVARRSMGFEAGSILDREFAQLEGRPVPAAQ